MKPLSVSVSREGNTWAAYTDLGELVETAPGRNSLMEALVWAARRRGCDALQIDGGEFVPVSAA